MKETTTVSQQQEPKRFAVFDIWEALGVTEHLGGISATRRLLEFCHGVAYFGLPWLLINSAFGGYTAYAVSCNA